MTAMPNLHLKWSAFRETIGHHHADAQIAQAIVPSSKEPPVSFSRLLYGDLGCTPEIAVELANTINRRLETYRKAQGLAPRGEIAISGLDLGLPVYEFTRRLLAAAGPVPAESLERAHHKLLNEIAPTFPSSDTSPRLKIERYSMEKWFDQMEPAGGPMEFEVGRHMGRLVVEGLTQDPVAAYALIARDPATTGQHLWDFKWDDTLRWLASPFEPLRVDGVHVLA